MYLLASMNVSVNMHYYPKNIVIANSDFEVDKIVAAREEMKMFRIGARILHTFKTKTKEEAQKFENVLPCVVSDLTHEYSDVPEGTNWLAQVLNYNVSSGQYSRGIMVPLFYKVLEDQHMLTPAKENLSNILGWCLELNQISLSIQGDILDVAETRRQKPCWYKLENVGVDAANDSVLLGNGIFEILRRNFSDDPFYVKYLEMLHEISWKFAMAKAFDIITTKEGKSNINSYTPIKYDVVAKHKAESNSFIFPVILAMCLAKKYDPVVFAKVKPTLEQTDRLVQADSDFMDAYGEPPYTHYTGTHIKNGSCTWLICMALERANPIQKRALQENYGRNDLEAIQKVKQIYVEVDVKGAYEEYEEQKLKFIRNQIGEISEGFPHKLFLEYFEEYITNKHWKGTKP